MLPGRQLRSAASARGASPAQEISPPFPPPRKAVSPSPHVLAQPDGGKGAAAQLAQSLVSRVEHLSFPHGVVASCGDHRQETLLTSLNALRLKEQLRTAVLPEERPDTSWWPPLAWEEPGTISALELHARGLTCALGCQHLLLHPLFHGPAAQQILARGDGGSGEPGCGTQAVRSSVFYSFKENWRAAGQPYLCCTLCALIPSSTPAVPSPPSLPSTSSAPGARLLQMLLALHGGRDYFKSSEEESWQAAAGQGSWQCAGQARARWEFQVSLCPLWIFRGLAGTVGSPPVAAGGESTHSPSPSWLRGDTSGLLLAGGASCSRWVRSRTCILETAVLHICPQSSPRARARVYH